MYDNISMACTQAGMLTHICSLATTTTTKSQTHTPVPRSVVLFVMLAVATASVPVVNGRSCGHSFQRNFLNMPNLFYVPS